MEMLAMMLFTDDLSKFTLTKLNISWDDDHKKIEAQIKNSGNSDCGPFVVSFDAEEMPASKDNNPKISCEVDGLAKNKIIDLAADFTSLTTPDNNNLVNVKRILVQLSIIMRNQKG
jgi:hypothetical protein